MASNLKLRSIFIYFPFLFLGGGGNSSTYNRGSRLQTAVIWTNLTTLCFEDFQWESSHIAGTVVPTGMPLPIFSVYSRIITT